MKLIYLIAVVVITFAAAFAFTLLLNIQWIKDEPVRSILVHVIVFGVLGVGRLVVKELLRNKNK